MRRAGWDVWMLPCGEGSYEEIPTNLNDFAARDFRWLTGELQHLKLICMPGLPPLSRYQLTFAATHYLGGTAWLGLTLVGAQAAFHCEKVPGDCVDQLDDGLKAMLVYSSLALTALCLFGSRFMMLILFLFKKEEAPGGVFKCIISMIFETVITTCLAPLFAMVTLWATLKILVGKGSGWDGQDREGRALTWWECIKALGPYVLFAITVPAIYLGMQAWGAATISAPFFVSVILALPATKLSSDPGPNGFGAWAKRHGLFLSKYEQPTPRPETVLETVEANLKEAMERHNSIATGSGRGRMNTIDRLDAWRSQSNTITSGLSTRRMRSTFSEGQEELRINAEIPLAMLPGGSLPNSLPNSLPKRSPVVGPTRDTPMPTIPSAGFNLNEMASSTLVAPDLKEIRETARENGSTTASSSSSAVPGLAVKSSSGNVNVACSPQL